MPTPRIIHVTAETTERLDRFLSDQLSISRTQAARLIGDGAVTVNGEAGRAGRGLRRGDVIVVTFPAHQPERPIRPSSITVDIAFEDDVMLVVDKPAGLVVHPAPGHRDDTLLNALVARGTPLSSKPGERRGIVHRLDRDTSGLMIVAKTDEAHRRLAGALQRRRIDRVYAALAWGHIKNRRLEIDAPIARHPLDRKRMMVVATGRPAQTTADQVARFSNCDLLRLTLGTGRTHQIRVHLAYVGHPVVCDPVYGGGGSRRVTPTLRVEAIKLEKAVPRQALHAAFLRFAHPMSGEMMEIRSSWPKDLEAGLRIAYPEIGSIAASDVLDNLGFFQ